MTVVTIARPKDWQPLLDLSRAAVDSLNAPAVSRSWVRCLVAKRRCPLAAAWHTKTESLERRPLVRIRGRTPPRTRAGTRTAACDDAAPAHQEVDGTCQHVFHLEREQCQYIRLADVGVVAPVVIDLLHVIEASGLRVGDMLLSIDGQPCVGLTASLLALYSAPDMLEEPAKCRLLVRRLRHPRQGAELAIELSTIWQHNKVVRADSTMRRIDNLRIPPSPPVSAAVGPARPVVPLVGSGRGREQAGTLSFDPFGGLGVAFPIVASVDMRSCGLLRLGDVLLAVNGTSVSSCEEASRAVAKVAGGELNLSILRWPRREKASFEATRAQHNRNSV